jgi:hypothetical protein
MKKYKKYLPLFFSLGLFIPFLIFAQTTVPNPLKYDTFAELVNAIVVFIRNLALVAAPIIFIIAGLRYYLAAGNPQEAQKATEMIKWAVIGLVIILIANGITSVIVSVMGVDSGI